MQKERVMAIFIGSIMILSVVSFGLSNANFGDTEPNKIDFPFIVDRELSNNEIVSILRSGRVIVEDIYAFNCTDCDGRNKFLELFFGRFSDFTVLQMMEGNETSLKIIGANGMIKDINDMELNDETMLDIFCEMAIAQPKECLLDLM